MHARRRRTRSCAFVTARESSRMDVGRGRWCRSFESLGSYLLLLCFDEFQSDTKSREPSLDQCPLRLAESVLCTNFFDLADRRGNGGNRLFELFSGVVTHLMLWRKGLRS